MFYYYNYNVLIIQDIDTISLNSGGNSGDGLAEWQRIPLQSV